VLIFKGSLTLPSESGEEKPYRAVKQHTGIARWVEKKDSRSSIGMLSVACLVCSEPVLIAGSAQLMLNERFLSFKMLFKW